MVLRTCLLAVICLPHVLAYSRIFQSNDDDFAFDSYYDWRSKKEQNGRNADLEAYLRQVMLHHQQGRSHHPQEDGGGEAGGGAGYPNLPRHGWPPELTPLAITFQRLQHHHQQQQHQLGEQPVSFSDFAVPPTDVRFFDPPPRLVAPHLYYNRDGSEDDEAEEERAPVRQADEEWTTEQRADETGESSTSPAIEAEMVEVVKTPLIDLASAEENIILVAVIAGCSTAAVVGVALLIYGFLRLQKKAKDAADVEYPAYGVTGPNKEATPTGDRRLAHSAQMYHYQLTKQQIIAMESSGRGERRGSISEADSEDDENEEGDYTVYECPGLAPTGEMEVKNPLFQDEPTPANNDQPKE